MSDEGDDWFSGQAFKIAISEALTARIESGYTLRQKQKHAAVKKKGRFGKKQIQAEAESITQDLIDTIKSVARFDHTGSTGHTHILVPDDEFDDPWV